MKMNRKGDVSMMLRKVDNHGDRDTSTHHECLHVL